MNGHLSFVFGVFALALSTTYQHVTCANPTTTNNRHIAELRCSKSEMEALQRQWQWLTRETTVSQKVTLFEAIMDYIETRNPSIGRMLRDQYMPAGFPVELLAYRMFVDNSISINMYSSPDVFKSHTEHHVLTYPTMIKESRKHFNLFVDASAVVLSTLIASQEEKISWQVCFEDMIRFSESIINRFRFHARCDVTVTSGDPASPIHGTINFTQPLRDETKTTIDIDLSGFPPGSPGRKHGMHIHEGGTIDDGCMKAGAHFNPHSKQHGCPMDEDRHVGDLGNIRIHADGRVIHTKVDEQISLFGPNNIIGRTLVIHALEDDLGRGSFADSKTTGHAGGRIGCCVVYQTYD